MDREAIEEAIEVLEDASAEMLMETGDENYYVEAITALRQVLVDADDTSQKRVDETVKCNNEITQEAVECLCGLCKLGKREWVGLTDGEAKKTFEEHNCVISADLAGILARAIEAKLLEKNT